MWVHDPERNYRVMATYEGLTREAARTAQAEGQPLALIVWPESMHRGGLYDYPDDPVGQMRALGLTVHAFDASALASRTGAFAERMRSAEPPPPVEMPAVREQVEELREELARAPEIVVNVPGLEDDVHDVTGLARVTRVAAERYELDTDAGYGASLLARLDRFKIRVRGRPVHVAVAGDGANATAVSSSHRSGSRNSTGDRPRAAAVARQDRPGREARHERETVGGERPSPSGEVGDEAGVVVRHGLTIMPPAPYGG